MTVISTMRLIEAGPDKVLAGFDADETAVFVLRKQTATNYHLHQIAVDNPQQTLRAFLAASDSKNGELVRAILQTADKPARKRRRRKAK